MKVITAPTPIDYAPSPMLFLAGGITDCPNWQKDALALIKPKDIDLIVCNPRRENFPIDDPSAAEEQITWEFNCLRESDAILFWFPKETLCPIVLYELGVHLAKNQSRTLKKLITIGCDPKYQRRQDVEVQSKLIGHSGPIYDSVDVLVKETIKAIKLTLL